MIVYTQIIVHSVLKTKGGWQGNKHVNVKIKRTDKCFPLTSDCLSTTHLSKKTAPKVHLNTQIVNHTSLQIHHSTQYPGSKYSGGNSVMF